MSAPTLDGNALVERLRKLYGTHPIVMEAADRIERDEYFRKSLRFCASGCGEDRADDRNPMFGFGDNSPFL